MSWERIRPDECPSEYCRCACGHDYYSWHWAAGYRRAIETGRLECIWSGEGGCPCEDLDCTTHPWKHARPRGLSPKDDRFFERLFKIPAKEARP